jgi:DNA polymerase III epsilon subunit family exonuclease
MDRPRAAFEQWIAFDVETTGLVAETDRIVEIGAVRFDASGEELGRFERLVHPERPMSPAAQAIHGISDLDLAGAAPARMVLPEFLAFLGDPAEAALVAHNAAFDAGFLGHEIARAGLPRPGHSVIDTLALALRRVPSLNNHRLDTLARLFNLDLEGQHRALGDCLRVKGLWLALNGPTTAPEELASYPILDPMRPVVVPLEWEPVSRAIPSGCRLRMEYSGGSRGEAPREVTPRGFVTRGGVPYLVAYCHLDAFEKSFRLDRVLRYEILIAPVGTETS